MNWIVKVSLCFLTLGSLAFAHSIEIRPIKAPVLTEQDFTQAEVATKEGVSTLKIKMSADGVRKMKAFTEQNVGSLLALLVDGHLIKAPVIRAPITGPGLDIDPLEKHQAEKLAEIINSQKK